MTEHPIRTYRKSAQLTQEALGERLGVSGKLITLIETGRRRVTPENAIAWAKVIPVTKEALCPEIFSKQEDVAVIESGPNGAARQEAA